MSLAMYIILTGVTQKHARCDAAMQVTTGTSDRKAELSNNGHECNYLQVNVYIALFTILDC